MCVSNFLENENIITNKKVLEVEVRLNGDLVEVVNKVKWGFNI